MIASRARACEPTGSSGAKTCRSQSGDSPHGFLVILPLSFLVPLLFQPLFSRVPWLGGRVPANVLITATIVLLVVYVFMPRVTRLFSRWLQPPAA